MLKYMLIPRIVHLWQTPQTPVQNATPIAPSAELVTERIWVMTHTIQWCYILSFSLSLKSSKLDGTIPTQPGKQGRRMATSYLSPLGYSDPSGLELCEGQSQCELQEDHLGNCLVKKALRAEW